MYLVLCLGEVEGLVGSLGHEQKLDGATEVTDLLAVLRHLYTHSMRDTSPVLEWIS